MCEITTGTIVSAAMMAAGNLMQQQAQEEAANRQQRAMNAALEQQDQYSRQAEQKGLENAQEYDPTKRTQRFEETRQAAGESLAQQLTQARESTPSTGQASGRLSKEFEAAAAKSSADQYQESVDMARLMGKMRGANDMLTNEGYTNADYASQLGIIGRNAQGSWSAAQPGINAAGVPDSGTMLAGGVLSGIGSAGVGKAMASRLGSGMLSASSPSASTIAAFGATKPALGSGMFGLM